MFQEIKRQKSKSKIIKFITNHYSARRWDGEESSKADHAALRGKLVFAL